MEAFPLPPLAGFPDVVTSIDITFGVALRTAVATCAKSAPVPVNARFADSMISFRLVVNGVNTVSCESRLNTATQVSGWLWLLRKSFTAFTAYCFVNASRLANTMQIRL